MAYVEDQLVLRRFKHIVQRHCKLDRAQIGRKMPTFFRNHANDFLSDFTAKRFQLTNVHLPDLRRIAYFS